MYLGIDIGTSELKTLLIDDNGNVVASSNVTLIVNRPKPNWAEQSPQSWWDATNQSVLLLKQKAPDAWSKVRAIGLSGQMGFVAQIEFRPIISLCP